MGAKAAGSQQGSIYGADSGEGTVRTSLNVGLYIIEGRSGLAAGAGSEKEGGQREGYDGEGKMAHRVRRGFNSTNILKNTQIR